LLPTVVGPNPYPLNRLSPDKLSLPLKLQSLYRIGYDELSSIEPIVHLQKNFLLAPAQQVILQDKASCLIKSAILPSKARILPSTISLSNLNYLLSRLISRAFINVKEA
jgi:hypothetical protein